MMLASQLKDDILLAQPAKIRVDCPPKILPPSIVFFLASSCNIEDDCAQDCWDTLKQSIWHETTFTDDGGDSFEKHGHGIGLSMFFGDLFNL
jgi:hypothetical protein